VRVEPKSLVRRLTPTATRMLEDAVARAATSRCYEIVVEHLLQKLLEDPNGEAGLILRRFQADPQRMAARVERSIHGLRTGNPGRPVISENIFRWFEDAWLLGSLEYGATRLRSGALFAQLVAQPDRYSAESFPELEAISMEALKKEFEEIVSGSPEAQEVVSANGAAAPSTSAVGGAAGRGSEALNRFTQSFTGRAREGKIDPIFGRDREIRQLIDVLARRRKNNPLIVGEAGVGKTALVEGLARAIVSGDVPSELKGVELLGLDLGALQAGAGVRGEFENRLKAVINEVKASPSPIVLFIDEAHTLIGAGGAAGGSDAANLLKPALARGELRTIAATTWSEYKKYFEKDAALERRFQPIKVEEPSEEDAILMVRGLRDTYEAAHGVTVREEAILAAVTLSHRYISGRQLPDKAVDLLDTATARVKMELQARPDELVMLETRLAALERERAGREREQAEGHVLPSVEGPSLEERIRAGKDELDGVRRRWEEQRAAAARVLEARKALASAQTGDERARLKEQLQQARSALGDAQGTEPLVHAEVDADAVARVVAGWTGVPVGKLRSKAIGSVLKLEGTLRERVRGQEEALRALAEVIRMSHAGIRNPDAPVGVLLFVGPSGVGKTETGLALADALYGGERFLTTINMSEFQEKHTVSRLIGSPPGYVGYGEGGRLTEAVRQRPYSVVLLDECEKADPEVMNLFYQVFDKGVLSDGEGRQVDFRNTVVILTSNLASDVVMRMFADGRTATAEQVAQEIRPVLSQRFKPALLARMTVVPFAPMQPEVLREITTLKLEALARRLHTAHRVKASFAPGVTEEIARRCTDAESGARNLDHILRGSLMPLVARTLLERIASGTLPPRMDVALDGEGGWSVTFAEA
jgi:type VI secretion system protein VasG